MLFSFSREVVLFVRLFFLTIVLTMLHDTVPVQTMAGITVLFAATVLQEGHKVW